MGWKAEIPAMDPAPLLQHRVMGMSMGGNHAMHGGSAMAGMAAMDHSKHNMGGMTAVEHAGDGQLGKAGFGSNRPITHASTENAHRSICERKIRVTALTIRALD